MNFERTKNAGRNIFFGTLLKVYQLLLPFAFRSLILYILGTEYLGLNSLFTSVLQVLNLAELGVGNAMVFSMYKPIVEGDSQTICALMRMYKLYYRIIGLVILFVGLLLLPFIPHLIHGGVPDDMNVYFLYALNLSATVLTYWLFAYKNSLLQAHQRVDVVSKVTIVTDTLKYLLQAAALLFFQSYYLYVVCTLIAQIMQNVITAVKANKMYPNYKPKGKLSKEKIKTINGRIRDLFTSKLGGTIVGSADTIVISAFLGLSVLAKYQNYYYILSSVMAFLSILYSSVTAGLGNSMLTKTPEQNYDDFETFTFLEFWLLNFCVGCFLCLYQPFMQLWMGSEMLLPFLLVVLLCVYFVLYEIVQMLSLYKDAAGIWHEDRFRPLISGLCNLVFNLLMVQFCGLYGIVLSTVFSVLFISLPWIIRNVFSLVFRKEPLLYVKKILRYLLVGTVINCVMYRIIAFLPNEGFIIFLLKGFVCVVFFNVLYGCFYRKCEYFRKSYSLVQKMLPSSLKRCFHE